MSAMFLLLEFISVIAIIGTISSVLPQFLIAAAFLTLLYCCMVSEVLRRSSRRR